MYIVKLESKTFFKTFLSHLYTDICATWTLNFGQSFSFYVVYSQDPKQDAYFLLVLSFIHLKNYQKRLNKTHTGIVRAFYCLYKVIAVTRWRFNETLEIVRIDIRLSEWNIILEINRSIRMFIDLSYRSLIHLALMLTAY